MFTHLHVHSEYSLLDGMCRIRPLVERAKELGMTALALTDHGVLHGAIQFYQACQEAGINPIIGCEAYVAAGSRHSRTAADKSPFHLTLLAKNEVGYRNLIQLVTDAHLEGFYYKPRMDRELLEAHHEGLIALSGCLNGEVPRLIQEGRLEEAKAAARWHREVFGDYFLELQKHPVPELATVNEALVAMSRDLDIPLVATNDFHYIHQTESYAHDVLLCIQTNATIYDEKRMKMADDSFYLKSPQEMVDLFTAWPEAIENTQRIAQMCDLRLDFERLHLPQFPTPQGLSPDDYLRQLCLEALPRRYPKVTPEIQERLEYELEVVRETQFADYFLVVWDFVRFAQERGILLGVRGSAAASIALYCLGITDLDPLAYGLVFERFLNVERKELPDIDMDFADDRRDEVIAYVAEKYGRDHVAQIITFGTLGARAAIRDVGRALAMPYGDVDRVARLVPAALHMTLDRALQESPEMALMHREDESVRHLVETARQLEGIARHASTHAAGVVISREPLTQHLPLQRPARGESAAIHVTQFAMEDLASIGLLKMDFLGLINLTILGKAVEIIAQTKGVRLDLQQMPLDDAMTFALLSSGETTGVFQLESAGMRRAVRELKPTSLGDIAALVALYRPGPMQHIPEFIEAKHGRKPVRFPHPALADILRDTYGVITYQDQVLLIAQAFSGYSLGRADVLRKAMGKKIPEVMRQERQEFIAGAVGKGYTQGVAQQIFDLIEPFAGYAFNKAHAVSYGLIAYQTAYLKANYPAEYMAAVMTAYMGSPDKIAAAVGECQRLGVPVLSPHVSHSEAAFSIQPLHEEAGGEKKLGIRFGLGAVKNVGTAVVEGIVAGHRDSGPYRDLGDFCRRADLRGMNKRALESLIKAGALDGFGGRGALLDALDRILAGAQRERRLQESGQATMFDLLGEEVAVPLPSFQLEETEVPLRQRLAWEKELLGVYLSEHPFAAVAGQAAGETTALCGQIDEELAGQTVVLAGMVASVRELRTKEGRAFVAAALEDLVGSVEVTAWPEVYERTRGLWEEGNLLLLRGKVTLRGDRVQVTCESVEQYRTREPKPKPEQPVVQESPLRDEKPLMVSRVYPELAEGNQSGFSSFDTAQDERIFSTQQREAVKGKESAWEGTAAPEHAVREKAPLDGMSTQEEEAGGERMADHEECTLVIRLEESQNQEGDVARLGAVMALLRRHPGTDGVRLQVVNAHRTVEMALPEVRVEYALDLHQELAHLVGDANVVVEGPG